MATKGVPFSKTHIQNLRKSHLGKFLSDKTKQKMSQSQKGANNGFYGKRHSQETRRKLREARKGQAFSAETRRKLSESHRGPKSHLWKGGITLLTKQIRTCFKYRQWRSDIFTRDDFTCVFCGKRGVYLEADHYPRSFSGIFLENHIQSLNDAISCEQLWNINNGRTLCRKCHNGTKKGKPKK